MIARNSPEYKQLVLKAYFAFSAFYGDLLNGRISRAYCIVMNGLISRKDENTYQVTSSDGLTTYTITFNPVTHENPGWQCTCPDCQPGGHAPVIEFGGGVQLTCKHIVAVMLAWTAQVHIPWTDAPPPPAPAANGNGRTYNRRTTCEVCKHDWQECICKTGQLPQPARVTTFDNIEEPLTVAEQKAAARNSLGIKQEAGRRIGADFGNPQRW